MLGFFPTASAPIASTGIPAIFVFIAGVSATGRVGTATVIAKARVYPAGLSATGRVGTVSVYLQKKVFVVGVAAQGQVGSVGFKIWTSIVPDQLPDYDGIVPLSDPDYIEIIPDQDPDFTSIAAMAASLYTYHGIAQSAAWVDTVIVGAEL